MSGDAPRAEKLRTAVDAAVAELEYYERFGLMSEDFAITFSEQMAALREALNEDDLDRYRPVARMLERTIVECDGQLQRTAGGAR